METEELIVEKLFKDDPFRKQWANKPMDPALLRAHGVVRRNLDVFYLDEDKRKRLLFRFRKRLFFEGPGRLENGEHELGEFYANIVNFMVSGSSARANTTGEHGNYTSQSKKVKSVVVGYFDQLSRKQHCMLNKVNIQLETGVRETRFTLDHPDMYAQMVPCLQTISTYFERLVPDAFQRQMAKADETEYRIPGTAFTTATVNLNHQTTIHRDRKDDPEGFGNLTVIEKGEYAGGEICFPQFGVGVDVRHGDILYMDVHQWHGNMPIEYRSPDAQRMSIVCYLMKKIWEETKGKPPGLMKRNTDLYLEARKLQNTWVWPVKKKDPS
jgi:hypothetical protein